MSLHLRPALDAYLAGLKDSFAQVPDQALNAAADAIVQTFKRGDVVYVCGNGGSGANASHIVVDYVKCLRTGAALPRVHALVDNAPTLTAVGNDLDYDQIFAYQLETYLKPGDLVWCLTGSGNSPNILRALAAARQRGNRTLLFCGYDGGKAKAMADLVVHYPSHDMQKCEDSQMVLANVIMQEVLRRGGLDKV